VDLARAQQRVGTTPPITTPVVAWTRPCVSLAAPRPAPLQLSASFLPSPPSILHSVAATARRRAERDPDANLVLGSLVDLLAYISEPSKKAAATRAKQQPKKKSSRPSHAPPQAAPAEDDIKPSPTST
jgi:hypothetical protein